MFLQLKFYIGYEALNFAITIYLGSYNFSTQFQAFDLM